MKLCQNVDIKKYDSGKFNVIIKYAFLLLLAFVNIYLTLDLIMFTSIKIHQTTVINHLFIHTEDRKKQETLCLRIKCYTDCCVLGYLLYLVS